MNLLELPKAELHRHLELSLRDETVKEIAPNFGFDLSKEGAFEHHFKILSPMKDLGSALHKFLDTQKLLASTEILERVAFEACEDAFKKEGIRVLELRYAPTFVALDHPNLTFDSIHEAFIKGIKAAEKEFPIAVGMIGILQRILSVEDNLKVMNFMVDHKDDFVGVDLADNEVGFDPTPFSPCFDLAKKHNLKITIHAGEAQEKGSERNILDSVNKLHASRIGHGIQCHRDEEVLNFVVEKQIPLEVCPTSNILTGAVSSIEEHPIRKLIDKGCFVTVNSDDPGIFNQDTLEDYQLLLDKNILTFDELNACSNRAAQASFISKEKVQKVWPTPL
jgi:adenosine deaminase